MLLRPASRRRTRGCAALAAIAAAQEASCLDDGTDPLPPACPIAATTAVALAAVDVAPAIAANPALVFGVGVLGAAATILFAAGLHAARSRDGLSALRSPLLRANK